MRLLSVLGLKLALLLAIVAIAASGLTGWFVYQQSERALIVNAERELSTATRVLGRRLSVAVTHAINTTRQMALFELTRQTLASGDQGLMLGDLFESMLQVQPAFRQIRLIGAADHGLERIKVSAVAGQPRRAPQQSLQEKAHFPYVFNALELPEGGVHLSHIGHSDDGDDNAPVPVLQVSAPVWVEGCAQGVAVLDVDLGQLFARVRADLPDRYRIYLTNEWGDFLLHPDPDKMFAFERGQRVLAQQEFPALDPLYAGSQTEVLTGTTQGDPGVAVFVRVPLVEGSVNRFVVLGLVRPTAEVLGEVRLLGRSTFSFVLGLSLLAAVLALFFARAVTRPVAQMVRAARAFSHNQQASALPVRRRDELGILARGLADMQAQIRQQMDELTDSHARLEALVRSDALTGLASRRHFAEQLPPALARARRRRSRLALVFVDLDHFKAVNDTYGHDVGDRLLIHVAHVLRDAVRQTDLVARLGGDEFVMLLEDLKQREDLDRLADTLLQAFRQPVEIAGHALEVGVSIGIALHPDDGDDAEALMKKADQAMYRAKARGRGTYHFHDAEPGEQPDPA